MTPELQQQIINHAKGEFPKESCGLLYVQNGVEKYMPCRNKAVKQIDFILDPLDYIRVSSLGSILGVVHSHCNIPAKPSQGDLVACEASGLPWHIISLPNETWHSWEPNGFKAPLYGREYLHGVLDCYSLIQDWYQIKKGITLPDFEREEGWVEKNQDLYMENFEKANFYKIDPKTIREGDIILMQVGKSSIVNHGAIYLEGDIILHHLINRLSSRDVYGGYWRKCTREVVRYGGTKS